MATVLRLWSLKIVCIIPFFKFVFGAAPSSVQGWLLTLYLGSTPGWARRTIWVAGDQTWISCVQDKSLSLGLHFYVTFLKFGEELGVPWPSKASLLPELPFDGDKQSGDPWGVAESLVIIPPRISGLQILLLPPTPPFLVLRPLV